jgi:hypothetical protein
VQAVVTLVYTSVWSSNVQCHQRMKVFPVETRMFLPRTTAKARVCALRQQGFVIPCHLSLLAAYLSLPPLFSLALLSLPAQHAANHGDRFSRDISFPHIPTRQGQQSILISPNASLADYDMYKHCEDLYGSIFHFSCNKRSGVYVSKRVPGIWIHCQRSSPFPEVYGSLACQLDA